jgi:hypothetical protein
VTATSADRQTASETVHYTVTQAAPSVAISGSPSTSAQGTAVLVDPGIKLSCPAGAAPCSSDQTATTTLRGSAAGAKTKKAVIGHAQFTASAGKQRELNFKLNGQGVRLLRKLGHLRVTVTVLSWVGHANKLTTTKTITIKQPRKHAHP